MFDLAYLPIWIILGAPVVLWLGFSIYMVGSYILWGHKTDYSGDGALALMIVLLPFIPLINLYDKVFGKKSK